MEEQGKGINRISQVFKSSISITFFSFLGRIFGFLTQIVLASRFGTASEMDAYLVSVTIPLMVLAIFLGSLRYTFIPVFVENRTKGRDKEAWMTATNFFNLSLIAFGSLTVLGIIYSENIISLIAPGLTAQSKTTASFLFMIQMPTILFSGLSALLSSVYFAEKKFILPAVAEFANPLVLFLIVYLFSSYLGIQSPAWGALIGSIVNFSLLIPIVLKKFHYKFYLSLKERGTITILKLMLPLLIGAVFYRADNLIQRFIASSLPIGSISYLGYAFRLSSTISFIIVSGISVVLLSHISELSSGNDSKGVQLTFFSAFRWLTFLIIPIIVTKVILGKDIIAVLFQRGQFNEFSTYHTWICLMLYSGFFYAASILSIVNPIFYAYKNTIIVMKIGITGAILQLILSFFFAKYFSYAGLPLAYSISQLIALSIFLLFLNKKYVRFSFKEMFKTQILFCSAGFTTGFLLWHLKISLLSNIHAIGKIVIIIPLVGLFYLAMCMMLKVPESIQLSKSFIRFVKVKI